MDLSTALSGAGAALEMLRTGLAARDDAKVQRALHDMSARLTDALMSGLAAAEKATSLQAALSQAQRDKADLEAQIEDRSRYALHEAKFGVFVYAFKPPAQGSPQAPAHYLCQACYDKGIKSVLQRGESGLLLCCAIDRAHNLRVTRDTPIEFPV